LFLPARLHARSDSAVCPFVDGQVSNDMKPLCDPYVAVGFAICYLLNLYQVGRENEVPSLRVEKDVQTISGVKCTDGFIYPLGTVTRIFAVEGRLGKVSCHSRFS